MLRQIIFAIVLCAVVSCAQNPLSADPGETWPQWRGPRRDGSVVAAAWPNGLQEPTLKQIWRTELPPSFSGPVVNEDTVFVTFTRDEQAEGVVALDRRTGNQRWKSEWEATMTVAELGTSMGSWIRATPTLDGQHLFVAGMPDLLVCLDVTTGNQRWQADLHTRYGTPLPELGFVSSPLVDEEGVYVQAADSLVKIDKQTGLSIWRCLERDDKGQGSYSSPDQAVIHGHRQLLVANIDDIAGVDPANGNVLWKRTLDSYDQGCIVAPIAYQDGIFTSTRASQTGYYPLTCQDKQFTLGDGWKNKLIVYMSAPIVIGDFAYMHLKNGRFACVDLRDGAINWISNRPFGKYCSLAWNQDIILALTNEGQLLLIKANPVQFELMDSRTIAQQETWGYIAVAGQQIFVREKNAVTAFEWTP
jgi:outer membrane protein assembly factor BamB